MLVFFFICGLLRCLLVCVLLLLIGVACVLLVVA